MQTLRAAFYLVRRTLLVGADFSGLDAFCLTVFCLAGACPRTDLTLPLDSLFVLAATVAVSSGTQRLSRNIVSSFSIRACSRLI